MIDVGDLAPDALLSAPLLDRDGSAAPLRAHLPPGPALLLFLRHFGCVGCSRQVEQLTPRVWELRDLGVTSVFIGNGRPEHLRGFVERHALADKEVVLLTDPELRAYAALDLERSLWSALRPKALFGQLKAFAAGFRGGRIEGDVEQQGGAALLDDARRIVWLRRAHYTADEVDGSDVVAAAMRLAVARRRQEGGLVL
ncbi:MAG: AhpC/TSA family protein [Myxococcales bacterium]|nr:AhpC/TSA family protein [Myxococcales bacterium]